MSLPDYSNQGFTAIRVELNDGVVVVTMTRSKEYVHLWIHSALCLLTSDQAKLVQRRVGRRPHQGIRPLRQG